MFWAYQCYQNISWKRHFTNESIPLSGAYHGYWNISLKGHYINQSIPLSERITVNRTSFRRSTWAAQGCPENVRNRVSEHNVLQRMLLDMVSIRLCFIHQLWERVGMNDPHPNSHPQFPQSLICPHTSDLKSKSKQFMVFFLYQEEKWLVLGLVNGESEILASDWPSQFDFDQWP